MRGGSGIIQRVVGVLDRPYSYKLRYAPPAMPMHGSKLDCTDRPEELENGVEVLGMARDVGHVRACQRAVSDGIDGEARVRALLSI